MLRVCFPCVCVYNVYAGVLQPRFPLRVMRVSRAVACFYISLFSFRSLSLFLRRRSTFERDENTPGVPTFLQAVHSASGRNTDPANIIIIIIVVLSSSVRTMEKKEDASFQSWRVKRLASRVCSDRYHHYHHSFLRRPSPAPIKLVLQCICIHVFYSCTYARVCSCKCVCYV